MINFKVIVGHRSRLPDELEALGVEVEFVFAATDIVHFHTFMSNVENIVLWNVGNICDWEVYKKWLLCSVSWEGCKIIEGCDDRLSIINTQICSFEKG